MLKYVTEKGKKNTCQTEVPHTQYKNSR